MEPAPGPSFDPRSAVEFFPGSLEFAGPPADLGGRLAAEMARRWRAGERPRAEEFLARHPELADDPEAAVDLVYEEICLRQEAGEPSAEEEVLARFPQWRRQLQLLLECHRVLEPERSGPRFPEAGEDLGGFRLLAELGRGAVGHVFLARQPDLADRLVVLKLTPRRGDEHLSLARLQHTNIVPIYSYHEDPGRSLRVLCMPYLGGATLARILERLRDRPPGERQGVDLLNALDAETPAAPPPTGGHNPWRRHLAGYNYSQAVCWIAAYLADALQYAHERGLLHLDLKPSNVLLAADGAPMLLDFHLARPAVRPDAPRPEWLGGTPGYMAPEQRAAVHAVAEDRPIPAVVDPRADVYALGLLLYEALGGTVPLGPGRPPRLDRLNPAVSPGLADLVAKCLKDDPRRRYGTAADLAGDLRRHLDNLPLVWVHNRLGEGWAKWRRRRRWGLQILIGAGALVLLAGAVAAVGVYVAVFAVDWGQQRADESERIQARAAAAAAHAQAVRHLHQVATALRFASADPDLSSGTAGPEADSRAVWDERHAVMDGLDDEPAPERAAIRTDLRDLAALWMDLAARGVGPGVDRAEAERVLAEAEELVGPDPADPRGQTAAGHYAAGRSLYQAGKLADADREFVRAVGLEPQALWAQFYHGVCAYRLKRPEEAALAFSACLALAPRQDAARHLYNRAKALAAAGRPEMALDDYGRALEYEPGLGVAALNRAILEYRARRYDDALQDLDRARKGHARLASVCYHRAVVLQAQGKRQAALRSLDEALAHEPDHAEARQLRDSLRRRR
jgi:serine/threonine protein kinase/tetratricopeptide (TPR) repeat protein